MAINFNNLAITAAGSALNSTTGALWNTVQSKLANNGRDSNCRFYYDFDAGGSILKVATRYLAGGAVSELKDLADNSFKKLMNGKDTKTIQESEWAYDTVKKNMEEVNQFGRMETDGGTILALDEWGCHAPEALMLGIEVKQEVTTTQTYMAVNPQNSNQYITKTIKSHTLVWYDTTAILNTSSDKNIVTTKVQGRDYSRKELVSNGDIKINVSGQITSGMPDVYPTKEVQKFLNIMQYKGIVRVNSQMLSSYGIENIIITDYNLSPKEGYKAMIPYSFSALGLAPKKQTQITEDTTTIYATENKQLASITENNGWVDLLKNQLDGLKSMATDLESQGTAIATGLLDNVL